MGTKTTEKALLKFGSSNAKLQGQGYATFSLPAGHSCPGAKDCKTHADESTGRIKDGFKQEFRCYAATIESRYPNVRSAAWHNFRLIKTARTEAKILELLKASLPWGWRGFRWHAAGDFFSQSYFNAFLALARERDQFLFYAYTKSLGMWVQALESGPLPSNVVLTASRGGKCDHLIKTHRLREAVVVGHPEEATSLGLKIDKDDSLARDPKVKKFALLIHGSQAAGSSASALLSRMRREGIKFSYSRKKNES